MPLSPRMAALMPQASRAGPPPGLDTGGGVLLRGPAGHRGRAQRVQWHNHGLRRDGRRQDVHAQLDRPRVRGHHPPRRGGGLCAGRRGPGPQVHGVHELHPDLHGADQRSPAARVGQHPDPGGLQRRVCERGAGGGGAAHGGLPAPAAARGEEPHRGLHSAQRQLLPLPRDRDAHGGEAEAGRPAGRDEAAVGGAGRPASERPGGEALPCGPRRLREAEKVGVGGGAGV
mmetsp:Transcript_34852/g.110060  ORF Transcript_34852/g.110060 Transcript_34852/m.110060 type:complete len:229 (+) Transcript_34852:1394-2080(+)